MRPHRDAQAGPRGRAGPHPRRCSPAPPARCCASRPTMRCRPRWPHMRASPAASCSSRRTMPPRSRRCSLAACSRRAGRGPGDRPRRPGGRVPRDHAGAPRSAPPSVAVARRSPTQPRAPAAQAPHAVLQGGAALLEGRLPDGGRAGADGGAVPADLRPRARGPCRGLPRRRLHELPGPGARDDERAAERVRQQQLVADPEQDHRQPRVPAGDAAVALGLVHGLCRRIGGARPAGGRGRAPGDGLVRAAAARRAVVDRRLRGAGRRRCSARSG